ncbi:MAG: site-specific integrase [Ignavibacteriales bacterium]|nr:site-specific integrase [Ignavibacteriales bacterium]
MFLSKRSNGIYYLWFINELGIKQAVSTQSKHKSDALKFLQQFKEKEHENKIKIQRLSFSQFKDDFLTYAQTIYTQKTRKTFSTALNEFQRVVGDVPMHKISVRNIEHFLALKMEEASAWTSRWCYISLASAFETAKRWKCITENPFRKVAKPKAPELLPTYFTQDDFRKLLAFIADKDFRALVLTAIYTAMRLNELLSLRWNSVDFARRVIAVENSEYFTTKTKRNRIIPMSEELFRLLLVRKEYATCELVFQSNGEKLHEGTTSKKFKRYVRKAELNDKLHFHSLRHSTASWLVQSGVSIYEIQKILGHATISTTQIYSHLAETTLRDTMNKISILN